MCVENFLKLYSALLSKEMYGIVISICTRPTLLDFWFFWKDFPEYIKGTYTTENLFLFHSIFTWFSMSLQRQVKPPLRSGGFFEEPVVVCKRYTIARIASTRIGSLCFNPDLPLLRNDSMNFENVSRFLGRKGLKMIFLKAFCRPPLS